MKKLLVILAMIISYGISFAQSPEGSKKLSSYDEFVNKTGTFIRYTEYELPDLVKASWKSYGTTSNLRKVSVGDNTKWYLHVEKERYQGDNISVYIPASDIEELLKAIQRLEQTFSSLDDIGAANYIEEKYETKDDLRIGFYIDKKVDKKGETQINKRWFLNLNYNYSGGSNYFNSSEELKSFFKTAIDAIDQYQN